MRCPTPISLRNPQGKSASERLAVPCGKCGACQQNRRSDWTYRLIWEEKGALSSYFITLTYDEDSIPWADGITTLYKPDLQNWFKRMRKITKFRYYAVGEYGTETARPHYHVLAFFAQAYTKEQIHSMLQKTWENGQFHVGFVSQASIHYCSKFHITTDKSKSDQMGRIPEFAVMSLKPAIGFNYLQKNASWHSNPKEYREFVINNGFKQRIPRYFRNKVFTEEQRQLINLRRQLKELNEPSKELLFDQKHGIGEYYKAILAKAKSFKRKIKTDRF